MATIILWNEATRLQTKTVKHLELFKPLLCCDQMRCLNQGANGSKSRTPLVAEQNGFPGECPTISKQSPGWISSLALKPRWRTRIWVAHEKGLRDKELRDAALKNQSVNFKLVHKQIKSSRGLEKGRKSKTWSKCVHFPRQSCAHNCMKFHVQSSSKVISSRTASSSPLIHILFS